MEIITEMQSHLVSLPTGHSAALASNSLLGLLHFSWNYAEANRT
jgi:hypothetical protein